MWSFFSRDAAKDFPYEIGAEIEGVNDYSVWKLHQGKKKVTKFFEYFSVIFRNILFYTI